MHSVNFTTKVISDEQCLKTFGAGMFEKTAEGFNGLFTFNRSDFNLESNTTYTVHYGSTNTCRFYCVTEGSHGPNGLYSEIMIYDLFSYAFMMISVKQT